MTEELNQNLENNSPVSEINATDDDKQGKYAIPAAIVIAGLLIASAVFYSNRDKKSEKAALLPTETKTNENAIIQVSADDDSFLGDENAPVTLIYFSDFQCPFCRKFWRENLPEIKEQYIETGKLKFVYRDFPLDGLHPGARLAAEAADCAKDQENFWEMHDKIFKEQDKLGASTQQFSISDIKNWAGEIELNTGQFNDCLDSKKYKDEVENDFQDGSRAGVEGTPTSFINGRKIVGAVPFSAISLVIEDALKKVEANNK
ncbi:MAG: DsbA family protein [Parcubacteria group bacterium]|nr:DsbA family protein [Parcubacteria group bacterium]